MQRETKTVSLVSGISAIIHTYLTAREANEIKEVMMKAMKIDIADLKVGNDVPLKGQIDGAILMEQERMAIKALVVSINGVSGPEVVENMRSDDYNKLVEEINIIRNGNLPSGK